MGGWLPPMTSEGAARSSADAPAPVDASGCSPRARRPNAIAAARQANGTAVVTYR